MFRRIETAGSLIAHWSRRKPSDDSVEATDARVDDDSRSQRQNNRSHMSDDYLLNEISITLDAHLLALQTSFRQWSGRQENILDKVMQRIETADMMRVDSLPVGLPLNSETPGFSETLEIPKSMPWNVKSETSRLSETLEIPESTPWNLKAPGSTDTLDSVPKSVSSRDGLLAGALDSNDTDVHRECSSGESSNRTRPSKLGDGSGQGSPSFGVEDKSGTPTSFEHGRPTRNSVIDKVAQMKQVGGSGILDGMSRQTTGSIRELFIDGEDDVAERKKVMQQFRFEGLCATAIVVNAILIAVETEYKIQDNDEPDLLGVISQAFNVWFLLELLIRMWTAGLKAWWTSKEDSKWNMFDLALVLLWLVDLMSFTLPSGEFQSIFRILRLLRVLRTLRIFRFVRAVREFRKMIYAIANSVNTLLWSMLLLVFEIFFFSIAFLQAVINLKEENGNRDLSALYEKFGGISKAYYSLFRSISGGINWGEVMDPLLELSPSWLYVGMFLVFISATLFGIMNVLTAVFVDSAMSSTNQNRDMLVLEKERAKRMYVTHIKEIFREIDDDGSGFISLGEVEQIFSNPNMSRLLQALEIEAYDARSMFKLLDLDDSGTVDIEEFCDGCLRLKGEAKSFDIQCLMYENQRLVTKMRALMVRHEEALGDVRQYMRRSSEHSARKLQSLTQDVSSGIGCLRTCLAELKKLAVKTLKRQESPQALCRQGSPLTPLRITKCDSGIRASMREGVPGVKTSSSLNSNNSTATPGSKLVSDSKKTTPDGSEGDSSREQTRNCMTIFDWQPRESKEFVHLPDVKAAPRFGPTCAPPQKRSLQGVVRL